MSTKNRFIFQTKSNKCKIIDVIREISSSAEWETFSASVAFASVAGVTLLKENIFDQSNSIKNTNWTLGLVRRETGKE